MAINWGIASVATALLMLLSDPAFGGVPRLVRLDYQRLEGAAACPDASSIQAGVAGRLGYEPFDQAAPDSVRALMQRAGQGLEARIELRDGQGRLKAERRLTSTGAGCAELASSVELAITIAVDALGRRPIAEAAGAEGIGAIQVEPSDAPSPAPATVGTILAPAGAPPAGRAPFWLLSAAGVMGFLSAPGTSLGLELGAAMVLGSFSLGVEGRADLPAAKSLRVGEASTWLAVGSVLPCYHKWLARACLVASAGALRASGHDLDEARTVTMFYAAAGARMGIAWPLSSRLAVAAHGDATSPLTQRKLAVDGGEVWSTPSVAFALGVGMVARFP